jgi:transcription antitermination factor NusG
VSIEPIQFEACTQFPALAPAAEQAAWYAVHTTARHEKRVAAHLEEKRVCTFLPLLVQLHKWSDRTSKVEVPMFSCYAFVRVGQTAEERLKVLRTPGVIGFVGSERQGTPIPDEQIESLRTAVQNKVACLPHPFVNAGKRVRVRGGSLDGVEGILLRQGADQSLILSVELLHRSMAIRVEGYEVELV